MNIRAASIPARLNADTLVAIAEMAAVLSVVDLMTFRSSAVPIFKEAYRWVSGPMASSDDIYMAKLMREMFRCERKRALASFPEVHARAVRMYRTYHSYAY